MEIDALLLEGKLAFNAQRAYSSFKWLVERSVTHFFCILNRCHMPLNIIFMWRSRWLICFLFYCSAKIPIYHSVGSPATLGPIRPTASLRLCRLRLWAMMSYLLQDPQLLYAILIYSTRVPAGPLQIRDPLQLPQHLHLLKLSYQGQCLSPPVKV